MSKEQRVCVTGGPKAGKTTYAEKRAEHYLRTYGVPMKVRHTDAIVHAFGTDRESWSKESAAVAGWFDEPGPWLVEGVTVARALRKWLASHPEGKPCDVVVWLEHPVAARTKGQETMAKATSTVFLEVVAELQKRGVQVMTRNVPVGESAAPKEVTGGEARSLERLAKRVGGGS